MTKHYKSFTEFEADAKTHPPHTQYFIRKVEKGELWVQVNIPEQVKVAEAIATVALGDINMQCVATGVTEFGVTGTCVPRVSHAPEHTCWWCGKPGATRHISDPLKPGQDWMHVDCYWELNNVIND